MSVAQARPTAGLISNRVRIFAACGAGAFLSASLTYALLVRVIPRDYVFYAAPRMINYHQVYPYQYIALTCLFYALTVSLSVSWLNRLLGWRRVLAILAVMAFSLLAASGPGGLLWTFHDMQAGHVPSWGFFWINVRWGFMAGLETGWAIVAFSIPYNIIGLAVGYWLTSWVLRTQTPQRLRES